MSDSPLTHSFWQRGQHAGFGPPTRAVCCKVMYIQNIEISVGTNIKRYKCFEINICKLKFGKIVNFDTMF